MQWVLQNFSPDRFIREYWQKKPCLIRDAFVDIQSPISAEELAGLACEEDVHSRLIQETGAVTPWQLRYGPFDESDFTSLPRTHYSLLVSECEKWITEISELQRLFYFIPQWRHDDVMISYAPPGGSVGPHVDEYDVFLIQLQGKRRWQYADSRLENPSLLPDLDLAILQTFQHDNDEILHPGDILYLPPGIAHHGIAVDHCLTCSIGFRAPTALESLESFLQEIDTNNLGTRRYSDATLETDRHSAEITKEEIERFRKLAKELLDQPSDIWIDSIGKLLTDTATRDDQIDDQAEDLLNSNWVKHVDSRFLYYRDGANIRFYVNGQLILLTNTLVNLEFVQLLCDGNPVEAKFIGNQGGELSDLLMTLINSNLVERLS